MIWWVNILLGFLIGSFLACYSEGYRNLFQSVLGKLASGGKKGKGKTTTKKKK